MAGENFPLWLVRSWGVCGSLLMIAGARLPTPWSLACGTDAFVRGWRTPWRAPVARSREERSGVEGRSPTRRLMLGQAQRVGRSADLALVARQPATPCERLTRAFR
jgi:hypothetical protein